VVFLADRLSNKRVRLCMAELGCGIILHATVCGGWMSLRPIHRLTRTKRSKDKIHVLQHLSRPEIVNYEGLINTQLMSYFGTGFCENRDIRREPDHVIDSG
jgi:hypothetical protein